MEENPFLTRRYLAAEIERYGWEIGDHTYGNLQVLEHGHGRLKVGRFGSIAHGATAVLGDHRMDMVSTYPFRSFFGWWPGAERGEADHVDRGGVEIGGDVWLGAHCCILAGARIGHGAVVGAHAVVRGAVPPYTIVAGNPARPLRTRFPPEVVERLLRTSWWDWPNEKVREHIALLTQPDVTRFLDAVLGPGG